MHIVYFVLRGSENLAIIMLGISCKYATRISVPDIHDDVHLAWILQSSLFYYHKYLGCPLNFEALEMVILQFKSCGTLFKNLD